MEGKLTKRFLMSFPDGVYLMSNVMDTMSESVFEEGVSPMAGREGQWKKIVKAGAEGRLCFTFKTKEEKEKVYAELIKQVVKK